MTDNKGKKALAVGIAFVAFTSQFGGGFASGNQIMRYFVDFGAWALVLPILSQGLLALFFRYGLKYAYRNKLYDYRSFSDSFYGKYSIVFSNLFELVYVLLVLSATSAAFATGGSVLRRLLGIPYMLCTLAVGVFIFAVATYGTKIVRRFALAISLLIITGLIAVLVPCIISRWDTITENIVSMAGGRMPVSSERTGAFAPALVSAVVYFSFELSTIGLMYQHIKPCTNERQIDRAAVYMFIINSAATLLTVVGLCAIVYMPELIDSETSRLVDIPMMLLAGQDGSAVALETVISLLIFLGVFSTGVNLISGMVARCVNGICRHEEENSPKRRRWRFLSAAFFTLAALVAAQTGIGNIVQGGYAILAIASLITVVIPFAVHMTVHFVKKK